MRWIVRALFFVLVGWLAAETVVERLVTAGMRVDAELVHTLLWLLTISALYGLLDWGRTAEYRIKRVIAEHMAEHGKEAGDEL